MFCIYFLNIENRTHTLFLYGIFDSEYFFCKCSIYILGESVYCVVVFFNYLFLYESREVIKLRQINNFIVKFQFFFVFLCSKSSFSLISV